MKKEIIKRVKDRVKDVTLKDISEGVDSIFDTISKALYEKKKVILKGFGSFSVVKKAGRISRNPRTGEKIKVPEKLSVKFRPAVKFRKGL